MARRRTNRKRHTASNATKKKSGSTASENRTATSGRENARRIPNWARFVIGAFVTAIIGLLVANLYPGIKNRLFSAPPITFKVNQFMGPGWGITVPDQHRLQPLLTSVNSCESLQAAAFKADGVPDYSSGLDLLVQGNTSSGVTITGMHVQVIKRTAPLNGANVFCQGAGSEAAMPINFNLNDRVPPAMGAPSAPGGSPSPGSKPSFFANGSVVHLNDGEVYPFQVAATVSASAVEWVIDVSIVVNGQPSTVTINDNGRPFATTAYLPNSQYGDLYEYDWSNQRRLLHFRSHARNPDDCAADVAMRALRSQGLSAPGRVLTVDCIGDLAHVEVWVPSERRFVHYLGYHRQSHWSFFASRKVRSSSYILGALFSRATIIHAGGSPKAFANAFGPYIVSSASIPANPGPYDHVPQLSVDSLGARAGCTAIQSLASLRALAGASQVATCKAQGVSLLILTFPDSASRNQFYTRVSKLYVNSKSRLARAVGNRQLLVIGPTWLLWGTYVTGRTGQQFAQEVGGEGGQYVFTYPDSMNGNQVPTIANGGL